jgi:hypothetical protein
MKDRELLEAAAKAAGIESLWWTKDGNKLFQRNGGEQKPWNPITNDGDAFRLAVKLGIPFHVFPEHHTVIAYGKKTDRNQEGFDAMEAINNADPYAAARRAIVRVAAEIAHGIKENT